MARVLITPRSLTADPHPELDLLRKAGHELVFATKGQVPSEAELLRLVPDVEGWLAGIESISRAVIEAADRLRVISRNGSGIDNLPMPLLDSRGIRVTRALAANATGVAEPALGLMLCACRQLHHVSYGVHGGGWPRLKGREVDGATVGVVGAGAIGRKVAGILVLMGAEVIAYDLTPDLGFLSGMVRYVGMGELVERSEILTLHCPMPQGGRPVLDAPALAAMPARAIIINTARAGLIDEDAVRVLLDSGLLAAYGTDVFTEEPPPPGSLAAHPGVIATSHIGGLTGASMQRATRAAVDELLAHLARQADAAFFEEPRTVPLPELLARPPGDVIRLHWLGQAGFVVDGAGRRAVIDPYLSNSLAEKYRGTKFLHRRMMPAPVAPEDIAHVDLVLAPHHHTDHLDPGTLPELMAANPGALLLAPTAARASALARAEIGAERLVTFDAGETATLAGFGITATRAAHEALERDAAGHHRFLGYALRIGGRTLFHSGDTVPFPGQAAEVAALGADLALLPANGRDSERKAHGVPGNMNVAEALGLARVAGIPVVIAHHFDLFDFNTVPRAELKAAARVYAAPALLPARADRVYLAYCGARDANQMRGAE